jgi:hypothetical protein
LSGWFERFVSDAGKDCDEQEIIANRRDKYFYNCESINKSNKSSSNNRTNLRFKKKETK